MEDDADNLFELDSDPDVARLLIHSIQFLREQSSSKRFLIAPVLRISHGYGFGQPLKIHDEFIDGFTRPSPAHGSEIELGYRLKKLLGARASDGRLKSIDSKGLKS